MSSFFLFLVDRAICYLIDGSYEGRHLHIILGFGTGSSSASLRLLDKFNKQAGLVF
jgi:hypothetical protein